MTASLNRRRALSGAATVGIGIPLLVACGGEDTTSVTDSTGSTSSPSSGGTTSSPSESSTGGGDGGGTPADALASTSDIEVGGGTIFADEGVVVTQPAAGEFKCFSAACTHQGCLVSSVSDGQIHCKCHNSSFSITDGSVINPPATAPLPEQAITVEGDSLVLG